MIEITLVCSRCKKKETSEFSDRDDVSYFVKDISDDHHLCEDCQNAYDQLREKLKKASRKAKEEFFNAIPDK